MCECVAGWTGVDCRSDVNECNASPCQHNGTCVNLDSSYLCICPPYWTGQHCDVDRVECTQTYCGNGGTCQEGMGTLPTCLCTPGNTIVTQTNMYFIATNYL